MLKELFIKQKQYIDHFFKHIDTAAAERFLQRLYECKGIIFFTGIGKSGLVAKKVAVTMTSTGTRALYLSPTNALHGDIGMVSPNDTFVIYSKSGESDELLNLIPYLRNKKVFITGLICKENSRIGNLCDDTIILPLESELDPHNLSPTTSTTIQMAFGDIIAMGLMEKKEFQIDQYKLNHPAGRIGKRMLLKVEDLMLTHDKIPLCTPDDKLVEKLVELSNKQCGCILVQDPSGALIGIFTDGDLRRSLQKLGSKALESPISDLMTPNPKSIHPNILAAQALKQMEGDQNNPVTVLPVVEEETKNIVGILKLHDILQSGI